MGLVFKIIFKTTWLLWVKEERTVFFFYCLLPSCQHKCQISTRTERIYVFILSLSIWKPGPHQTNIAEKRVDIWVIFNMVVCSACIFLWWFFKILKNFNSNFISVDFQTHVSTWFLISMKSCTRIINIKKGGTKGQLAPKN